MLRKILPEKLKDFYAHAKQAWLGKVRLEDNIENVSAGLQRPIDAVALQLSPEQIARIESAQEKYVEILKRNSLYKTLGDFEIDAKCPADGETTLYKDSTNASGLRDTALSQLTPEEKQTFTDAKLGLINAYREVVGDAFDGKDFEIAYLPYSPKEFKHPRPTPSRLSMYSLNKDAPTVALPSRFGQDDTAPAGTAFFCGRDFKHSAINPGTAMIIARSVPEQNM